MSKLSLITGLATFLTTIPLAASAASPYCGDRVCHSYDSSGACTNYTCYGGSYGYGSNYGYNYGSNCGYGLGLRNQYNYRSNSNCNYNYRNNNNRYYYDSRYDNRYRYNNTYYGNNRRPSRSSYYWDDSWYYPNYDDRIYVPKSGYYYRY